MVWETNSSSIIKRAHEKMHFFKVLLKSTATILPILNHREHPHHIYHCVVPCILCPLQSETGAHHVGNQLTHTTGAVNERTTSCQSQEQGEEDSAGPHTHPEWAKSVSPPAKTNFVLFFDLCTVTLPPYLKTSALMWWKAGDDSNTMTAPWFCDSLPVKLTCQFCG